MIDPLITIQIPTYNQKHYIKEALDSALAQTYKNLQIIVSDDCSPDYDIVEYLSEYTDNPTVIIHRNEKNLGRVGNYRNTLYNLVEGEWFVNLDGDDYFTDINFLSTAALFLKNYEPLMYQGNHDLNKVKNEFDTYQEIDSFTGIVNSHNFLINWSSLNSFRHSSTIFNTSAAKINGFYNFDCIFSDFNSAAKLWSVLGMVIITSRDCSHWREHGNNDTFTLDLKTVENELRSIDDIITISSARIPKNKLLAFVKFKSKHIITHTAVGFGISGNWKKELIFLINHFTFSKFYLKLLVRFVNNSMKGL